MINFASLFNQFRSSSNNAVNELLQQNDPTLSKLIDQQSFINEYKSGNTKLLQYMKYDKIKQLVNYITIVGPPDDKKRSYKFPQTAADVLSADISSIVDYLLPDGKIYDEKKTYHEEIVETEVDVQDQETTKGQIDDTKEQKSQGEQEDKQKTIIKDSLDLSQQEAKPTNDDQPTPTTQTPITEQSKPQAQPQKLPQFKPAQQKIKVQKIQQVQKIEKIEVSPLINYLFSYFDQEVNYILTGYVCKVLTALFTKKGDKMMEFLFTNDRVEKMVKHIESRSVGEFLLKVLTYESSKWVAERAEFFTLLLTKLADDNTVHVLSNFSSFIAQTIQKAAMNTKQSTAIPQFTQIFFTPQVVTIVIKNVMSDYQNVCVYNAPILFTYLNNVPFTLPKNQTVIQQFKVLLNMFIDKSMDKLNVSNKQRPKLGFGRVKIIQILEYILKENLIGAREMFARKENAFETLFRLCRNYQMNNVLHNQVVKLIALSFDDENLSQALLKDNVLLNFLASQANEDLHIRQGTGKQKYRKGYIGHVVQIARLVQQNASKGNVAASKILQTDKFDSVLTKLVDKYVSEGNKNLGGFNFNKTVKSEIMFQKQDIITRYIDFLTHSPKPVFQAQPQHVNIEHPDFLQEIQRQLEENLSLEEQAKQQQVNVGVRHLDKVDEAIQTPPILELIEIELNANIKFFKGHLDYDLDMLMGDL